MFRAQVIENNPKITALFTAFRQELSSGFHFHGETHDFWELVCVTDGRISVAADERVFELKKGQAILHSPMQFHNISCLNNAPATVTIFSFTGDSIPNIQNNICEISDISEVKSLIELIKKYYNFDGIHVMEPKNRGNSYLLLIKRLELFLLNLAENLVHNKQVKSQGALNYSVIVNTINERIEERLTVGQLATLCNMSEINLKKTFSRYAGVGVMEYYNRNKMRYADELIRSGLSVKETAMKLGFLDQNYFSTVFKRIIGHTPNESKTK